MATEYGGVDRQQLVLVLRVRRVDAGSRVEQIVHIVDPPVPSCAVQLDIELGPWRWRTRFDASGRCFVILRRPRRLRRLRSFALILLATRLSRRRRLLLLGEQRLGRGVGGGGIALELGLLGGGVLDLDALALCQR